MFVLYKSGPHTRRFTTHVCQMPAENTGKKGDTITSPIPVSKAVRPQNLTARAIIRNPRLLGVFLSHWVAKAPDISDHPIITARMLLFFQKNKKKGFRERRLAHTELDGLCGDMYRESKSHVCHLLTHVCHFTSVFINTTIH